MNERVLPSWEADLRASLIRNGPVASADRSHETISYSVVAGAWDRLVRGLSDLVMYLYQAVPDAAEPATWNAGGRVRTRAWERLLAPSPARPDVYPQLQMRVGEAFAWWHELTDPEVTYPQRPMPSSSQPVVDSVSLLAQGDTHSIRAAQAKAYRGNFRPPTRSALQGFARLQRGDEDEFWGELMRRFALELAGSGIDASDATDVSAGDVRYFGATVIARAPVTSDPAHDYATSVVAIAPDGRRLVLFPMDSTLTLVGAVRSAICDAVEGVECDP